MRRFAIIAFILVGIIFPYLAMAQVSNTLHIEEEDIVNAIRQEFSDRGIAEVESVDVELFSGQADFHIEGAQEAKILVDRLKVDENLGRFSCGVEIFADRISVASSALWQH